jgi:hypothetical protein
MLYLLYWKYPMISFETPRNSQLLNGLEAAIGELPNVSVHSRQDEAIIHDFNFDSILDIVAAGKHTTLIVEAKNSIFPRDARESIWQIRQYADSLPHARESSQAIFVLAAPTISRGAKEFLRNEHIGYYEEGGSLYLPGDGFYVLLDRPPSKAASKSSRALFTGKRSQVVHALLINRNQWLSVNELAEKAFVSSATASQVLTNLGRHDWVSSRGNGPNKERMLIDPRGLLDEWVKQTMGLPRPLVRRFYVPSLKPEELLTRIDEVCSARGAAYSITQEWAAQIYSPFLSSIPQVRFRLPGDQPIGEVARDLNAREVQEGSNLGIIESRSYGDFLFRERERSVWLASPILVYLDLLQGDGRAKEMADHLRQERIGF